MRHMNAARQSSERAHDRLRYTRTTVCRSHRTNPLPVELSGLPVCGLDGGGIPIFLIRPVHSALAKSRRRCF